MEGVDYLAEERNKAGFDVNCMKIVWYGSQRDFDISDRMAKLVASDPVCLFFISFLEFLSFYCFLCMCV